VKFNRLVFCYQFTNNMPKVINKTKRKIPYTDKLLLSVGALFVIIFFSLVIDLSTGSDVYTVSVLDARKYSGLNSPKNLIAESDYDRVFLQWEEIPSASSYVVYRQDNENKEFEELAEVEDNFYLDMVGREAGNSVASNLIVASLENPVAFYLASENEIRIDWSEDNPEELYDVYRFECQDTVDLNCGLGENIVNVQKINQYPLTENYYIDSTINQEKVYRYNVQIVRDDLIELKGISNLVWTNSNENDLTARYNSLDNRIEIDWSGIQIEALENHELYRVECENIIDFDCELDNAIKLHTDLSVEQAFADENIVNNKIYRYFVSNLARENDNNRFIYQVAAKNKSGQGNLSDAVS